MNGSRLLYNNFFSVMYRVCLCVAFRLPRLPLRCYRKIRGTYALAGLACFVSPMYFGQVVLCIFCRVVTAELWLFP